MNDDDEVEKIVIRVGPPRKVLYPFFAWEVICTILGITVGLPEWVWWLNLAVVIALCSYTYYDYHRVRKLTG